MAKETLAADFISFMKNYSPSVIVKPIDKSDPTMADAPVVMSVDASLCFNVDLREQPDYPPASNWVIKYGADNVLAKKIGFNPTLFSPDM